MEPRRGRSRPRPQPVAPSLTGQVLCLILQRLDVQSRCRAAGVSCEWLAEVAKPAAWRCLVFSSRSTDEHLARAVTKAGGPLHSLRLEGCKDISRAGFRQAVSAQATPLLRELVITDDSKLTASILVAALSTGSLNVLSIRGLEAGSASIASLRALLAPDGVLDAVRICNAPAQLRDAEEGSWMGRCNHLCAASKLRMRCDVCQVSYCSACVALMKERNSWVSAKCDGEGCKATVCSRCVFASKHRGDADGEAHVA